METKGHEASQTNTPGFALSALTIGLNSLNDVVKTLSKKAEANNLDGYDLAVIQIFCSVLKGHISEIELLLNKLIIIDPLGKNK